MKFKLEKYKYSLIACAGLICYLVINNIDFRDYSTMSVTEAFCNDSVTTNRFDFPTYDYAVNFNWCKKNARRLIRNYEREQAEEKRREEKSRKLQIEMAKRRRAEALERERLLQIERDRFKKDLEENFENYFR